MFRRLASKNLKNISLDSDKSHIYLKDTDFALVIMRPYDLVQLGDLIGSGSEDILIWTGKTIGKALCKNIQENRKIKSKKQLFQELLVNLMNMGYGKFEMSYIENTSVKISVFNSIVQEVQSKQDATLISNLYSGIFLGSLAFAGAEVFPKLTDISMESQKPCVFEFEFIS
ncbi:MAG: hypothetical protein JW776_02845 [Candidatus Lokiarchaeota archaeon]|nr:hypothetical protein [Candidatus Lokiarchaeota archaeon]